MTRATYPAAIGLGCMVGGGAPPLLAAEWSVAPSFAWSADDDSNRLYELNDARPSQSAFVYADLPFKRATETMQATIDTWVRLQHFTDPRLGNVDDGSVNAAYTSSTELRQLALSGSITDESTLTTEATETGILRGDTHRRTEQGGWSWTWLHAESHALVLQAAYSDVSYQGAAAQLLQGYRYPSVSLGERTDWSDRTTVTVSAFADALNTRMSVDDSHEAGVQVEIKYAASERTHLDASIGASNRSIVGVESRGTVGTFTLSHDTERGRVGLAYSRSLVPYGNGILVERQQTSATASRSLTPYLDADLSLLRVENNQFAVLLALDRRSYDEAALGFSWRPAETWTVRTQVAVSRAQVFAATPNIDERRGSVMVTWTPLPGSRSF